MQATRSCRGFARTCFALVAATLLAAPAAQAQNVWQVAAGSNSSGSTGDWGTVEAYSESTVNAWWGSQSGVSASHCVWAGSEPSPRHDTTVDWGGTWTNSSGTTYPCTGSAAVWWLACPPNTERVAGTSVCLPVIDKDEDRPDKPCGFGNPVYPLTGAKRQRQGLFASIAGQALAMTYDTRGRLPNTSGAAIDWLATGLDSFGALWQSSLHKKLVFQGNGGVPGSAVSGVALQRGSGAWETFAVDASGRYAANTQPAHVLSYLGNGWRLVDELAGTEETYDANGFITSAVDVDGNSLSYTYSTASTPPSIAPVPGLLIGVADRFGRTLSFTYEAVTDGHPRINGFTSTDGQVTSLHYDAHGNLVTIAWPGQPATQALGFTYTDPTNLWALTGITDENGRPYAAYAYDGLGRALSTEHAGGVEKFTVNYPADEGSRPRWQISEVEDDQAGVIWRTHAWSSSVAPATLTDPRGQQITMTAANVAGMNLEDSQSQPAGSGCNASTSARAFDTNANIVRLDDFNGNRSCYAYEARNLQAVALEGLPSSMTCPTDLAGYVPPKPGYAGYDATHPQRKTTTAWHPAWAFKVREASPFKLVTWVYNQQPDPITGTTASCANAAPALPDGQKVAVLCARYEQATSDATGALGLAATPVGAARKWSYTYNANGQVKTVTAPLQSSGDKLNHTTTYAYYNNTSFPDGASGHTTGDLMSVTNPLGQVTQYTLYDKAGRLLSMTDRNGAVTSMSYWPRGLLHTQTFTPPDGMAETTTYQYWPTGLLNIATLPDATTLTYTYDDAHRLTDVADNLGNTVHYALDNQGNRTGEDVHDASGRLAGQVARVYDALNRLQTVTGATH